MNTVAPNRATRKTLFHQTRIISSTFHFDLLPNIRWRHLGQNKVSELAFWLQSYFPKHSCLIYEFASYCPSLIPSSILITLLVDGVCWFFRAHELEDIGFYLNFDLVLFYCQCQWKFLSVFAFVNCRYCCYNKGASSRKKWPRRYRWKQSRTNWSGSRRSLRSRHILVIKA